MKRQLAALAACLGAFVFATATHAGTQNTTAAGAVSYEVGAGWVTHSVDVNAQDRWFAFTEFAGRSYCVEAALGVATYFPLDPNLTLYSDSNGTNVFLANDNGAADPSQNKGARVCYQSPLAVGATLVRLFKVTVPIVANSGDSGFVRVRVTETSLIFPVISLKNDNNGTAIKTVVVYVTNNTTVDINASLYVPGWGSVAQFTGNSIVKAANQATNSKKSLASKGGNPPNGVPGWEWTGAAYLIHDGPPGALDAWVDTPDPSGSGTVRLYANPR